MTHPPGQMFSLLLFRSFFTSEFPFFFFFFFYSPSFSPPFPYPELTAFLVKHGWTLCLFPSILTPLPSFFFLVLLLFSSSNSALQSTYVRMAFDSSLLLSDLNSPLGLGVREEATLPQIWAAGKWSQTTHQADGQAHQSAGSGKQAHAKVGWARVNSLWIKWTLTAAHPEKFERSFSRFFSEWWTSCCQLIVGIILRCVEPGWPQKLTRRTTKNSNTLCWGRGAWSGLTRKGRGRSRKVEGFVWSHRRQMRQEKLDSAASWHLSSLSHICNTTRIAPAVSHHTFTTLFTLWLLGCIREEEGK